MPGISLGPIASGLPKDLVQRLVDAEREPIRQLEAKKQNEEAKLKLAQDLAKRVSEMSLGFKDMTQYRNFRELAAVSPRPDLLDVTVDKKSAEPGNYQLEVMQMAARSSVLSNGFADPDDTEVGAGYFSYKLPSGESREVYISSDDSTLNGIARAINGQKDLDLQALVVNDGSGSDEPFRLMVTHKLSGEANDAEYPDFYFLDGDNDFYVDQERPAINSKLKVNGFEVEFDSNKVTSLLPGVTLDLKDAAPGKEFTLNIKEDTKSVRGKIEGMIGKINEVLSFIQQQNKLDKDSNTRSTLGGDVTLQTLEYKIRNLVLTPLNTEFGPVRFGDLGVQFNRNGILDFNGEKFEKALSNNYEAVSQFFVGTSSEAGDGFIAQVDAVATMMSRDNGVVQSRVDGIKRRIKEIDKQIETKERQVGNVEKSIKEKYANLEGTIARMKAQQASMAGSLGSQSILPGL